MKRSVPIAVLAASILATLIVLACQSNDSATKDLDTQQRDTTEIRTIERAKLAWGDSEDFPRVMKLAP